jgi:type II secretory pathway component PulC
MQRACLAPTILILLAMLLFPNYSQAARDFAGYSSISRRNIFRPLWTVSFDTPEDTSRREELEALQKSEKERADQAKQAEEQSKQETKKRELEQSYSLNGIVSDNGRLQAILQNKQGMTFFLFQNDTFEGGRVTSIDAATSRVVVDYQGKFTITYTMQ